MPEQDTNDPLISIILPVFNGEEFLSESIRSCLNQTYKNLELIIVNDGSFDSSGKIAQEFQLTDHRIIIIENSFNQNLPKSLNLGHERAKGHYITWTSHDNKFKENAISELLFFLQNSKADIVFSNFDLIDDQSKSCGSYKYNGINTLLFDNIVRASFMYRREVYLNSNGYDTELFRIEDYAFWLSVSKKFVIKHLNKNLYYYRAHKDSLTSKKTIAHFVYKKNYLSTVELMYQKYLESFSLGSEKKMAQTFCNLHLNQEINVKSFLRDFSNFKNKTEDVLKLYGEKKVLTEIDTRIRYNIQRFESNQNLKTLLIILQFRPKIFLKYNKKRTLKIIGLCLKF